MIEELREPNNFIFHIFINSMIRAPRILRIFYFFHYERGPVRSRVKDRYSYISKVSIFVSRLCRKKTIDHSVE